jgi:hypothetical protein
MKARGLQPRLNNAHSIAYTLLKACFNRIRKGWRPGGYPPRGPVLGGPHSNLPGLRPAEARQLLHVLQPGLMQVQGGGGGAGGGVAGAGGGGGGSSSRGAGAGGQARRYTFLDNADNINWPLLALSTYRDFVSCGYKPHLEVLDKLLACLRLQLPKQPAPTPADLQLRALQLQAQLAPHPGAAAAAGAHGVAALQGGGAEPGAAAAPGSGGGASSGAHAPQQQQQGLGDQWAQSAAILRDLVRERRALLGEERPYEVPFDKRAMDAVGDAVSMGLLPAVKVSGRALAGCTRGSSDDAGSAHALDSGTRCAGRLAWLRQSPSVQRQPAPALCTPPTPCPPPPPTHTHTTRSHTPQLDSPLKVDMRCFPPMVAEAYVHVLMAAVESRTAAALAEGKRQPVAQPVRVLVPPFDPNYVMWPSYVEKLHAHYSEQLLARQVRACRARVCVCVCVRVCVWGVGVVCVGALSSRCAATRAASNVCACSHALRRNTPLNTTQHNTTQHNTTQHNTTPHRRSCGRRPWQRAHARLRSPRATRCPSTTTTTSRTTSCC